MAESAARRCACSALRCDAPPNSRWYSAIALSISRFFGSRAAPSATPKPSAALRLATRKSRMPCSAMMRAASWASARRTLSPRVGCRFTWLPPLEDGLARRLALRSLRQVARLLRRGQMIHHEELRDAVGILGAHQRAARRRDAQGDESVGHRPALLG